MKEILIDLLGSDYGQEELLKGVVETIKAYPDYLFVCVGEKKIILDTLKKNKISEDKVKIIDTKDVLRNDDNPMLIARGEYASTSIIKCFAYLKENADNAIGLITCGATGGVLVGSRFKLGLIDNVQTPALGALLKHYNGKNFLLVDCGANLSFNAEKYVEFAHIGNAFMQAYHKIKKPRIGLLNVGKEEHKGSDLLKETHKLMKEQDFNFIGNVEGNDVFLDKADVVICDGYSGNVLLKSAEVVGTIASTIARNNKDEKTAKEIDSLFKYTSQGGALILGTKKIIYKAHGNSKADSILPICKDLIELDKNNYIKIIQEEMKK